MSAMYGRGAIDICLSIKGALAKIRLGNTALHYVLSNATRRITLIPTYHATHNNVCCAAQ